MADKVGILGGSFNPIHNGHISICKEAYMKLGLDKVYLMPNENPPHKKNQKLLCGKKRLDMCKIVASKYDFIDVIEDEIGSNKTNYTIDTIKSLIKGKLADKEIYFIIGADTLLQIETWKSYNELLNLIKIICLMRPGFDKIKINKKIELLNNKFNNSIIKLETELFLASSTKIRNNIKNEEILNMLDDNVLKYINEKKLYR